MTDQNAKKIIEDFLKKVPEMKSRPTLSIYDGFLELIRRKLKQQLKMRRIINNERNIR